MPLTAALTAAFMSLSEVSSDLRWRTQMHRVARFPPLLLGAGRNMRHQPVAMTP